MHLGRYDIYQLFSDFLIPHITVQSVISYSVKPFWQDVLNHPSHELECREGFMLDLSCFVVPIPVADRFAVIAFNPSHRDGWRDDILGQVLCQALSSGRHLSGLKESNEALGIISPGLVDVFFNGRIGNLFSEQVQEVVLPFSVHDVVWDIGNRFPLAVFAKATGGHEDMKMGVVMAGSSGGLEHNDVSDVEFNAGVRVENVFETGMPCSHEEAEQFGITIKPGMQKLRHGQDHMAIRDTRKEASSDEVGPSVGIDLGTGKTKARFAGEGNTAYFSTVAASVLHEAHFFGIAAVQHFLDGISVVRTVKAWTELFKRIPVIIENLFEYVFVNAFHGCSLRTTIPELTE